MTIEDIRARLSQDTRLYDPDVLQNDTDGGRFGNLGFKVGQWWTTRKALVEAGVHGRRVAGICGSSKGAYSVVLSGAYDDDVDEGETFVYTGTGGKDDSFGAKGPQTANQTFDHLDNASLKKSAEYKRPVRVIRGTNESSRFAPEEGFRYDGLYIVEEAFMDKGVSGFEVCKFKFRRDKNQLPLPIA